MVIVPISVDTVIPIEFPDAVQLKIVFDKRCRTEQGCDYVRFFQGSTVVGETKYHGRQLHSFSDASIRFIEIGIRECGGVNCKVMYLQVLFCVWCL